MSNPDDVKRSRLIAAAKRVCDERLLLHRALQLVPGVPVTIEIGAIDHGPDCPACALREAVEDLTGKKVDS